MTEYGLPEPKFENRRNEFVVTLFNGVTTVTTPIEAVQEKKDLLTFCQTPRTRREIADYLKSGGFIYAEQQYAAAVLVGEAGQRIIQSFRTIHMSRLAFDRLRLGFSFANSIC